MKKAMDMYDLPLLRAAKFQPGFSGTSWFGRDRSGSVWQAQIDERNSLLSFRLETNNKWGPNGPLYIQDFEKLFSTGNDE